MYGTPGGIVLMFGGEVAYLYLAIPARLPSEVWFQGKIRPASALATAREMSIFQVKRSRSSRVELQDRHVPFAHPAFRRRDVFRTSKSGAAKHKRTKWRTFADQAA